LQGQLQNIGKEFNKTSDEIVNIYCMVSGRLPMLREYLAQEKARRESASKLGSQPGLRFKGGSS